MPHDSLGQEGTERTSIYKTLIRNCKSKDLDLVDVEHILHGNEETIMISIVTNFISIISAEMAPIVSSDLDIDDGRGPVFDNDEIGLSKATVGTNTGLHMGSFKLRVIAMEQKFYNIIMSPHSPPVCTGALLDDMIGCFSQITPVTAFLVSLLANATSEPDFGW